MTEPRIYNVYCDESCHLEHDDIPVMALGALSCPEKEVANVAEAARALKTAHCLKPSFETKWTKVSPARVSFYLELINLFLADERLRFRGLVVPDKSLLNHARFNQSHDDWYYKMYYTMLRHIFSTPHRYRIYIDIKDTRGGPRIRSLHDTLAKSLFDFDHQTIERVQQMHSHESELLQITDLLIGALTYVNRGLKTSSAKTAIVERLCDDFGQHALTRTSAFAAAKFNILVWRAQEVAG